VAATSRKQLICDRRGGIPLSTQASSITARRLTGVRVPGAVTEPWEVNLLGLFYFNGTDCQVSPLLAARRVFLQTLNRRASAPVGLSDLRIKTMICSLSFALG
jgi:hypothetical protein